MFEIRVAVIGNVSVGKTTLINALFGEEYGEVAMKRTTAVVNNFRILSSGSGIGNSPADPSASVDDDSIEFVTSNPSASTTLKETKSDNAKYRTSAVVKERDFEITLNEPFIKMRPGTQLVVVDVPGLNEASVRSKYNDYVEKNWHSFDVVVLVTDARQGVNTDEQHDLLYLPKWNMDKTKDVPLIVVCNKVDDPDNAEQQALVTETRQEIERMYNVSDRKASLQAILGPKKDEVKDPYPIVVPMSAMHAYLYRIGAQLTFDAFCKMDQDFIDKIGKDCYGRQWRRFDQEQQLKKAFEAVSDNEQRQDGLDASNFGKFIDVLSFCLGDEAKQFCLLEKQVTFVRSRMENGNTESDFGTEILWMHKTLLLLDKPVDDVPDTFWKGYKKLKADAFEKIRNRLSYPLIAAFAAPMDQLFNYLKAVKSLGWSDEVEAVEKAVKEMVLQYSIGVATSTALKHMAVRDRYLVIGGMLLAVNETFNMHFGFLKLHLEMLQKTSGERVDPECPNCGSFMVLSPLHGIHDCKGCSKKFIKAGVANCPLCAALQQNLVSPTPKVPCKLSLVDDKNDFMQAKCERSGCMFVVMPRDWPEMKVRNGELVPHGNVDFNEYLPATLDHPEHFGYVLWKGCKILQSIHDLGTSSSV